MMLQISSLPFRRLVIAEFSGFLSLEEVADYERKKMAVVESMGLSSGEFDVLVDSTQCDIQAQEVIAAFQHNITTTSCRPRRVALVRASSLVRMQAQRALVRDNAALFDSRAEALDWLYKESVTA